MSWSNIHQYYLTQIFFFLNELDRYKSAVSELLCHESSIIEKKNPPYLLLFHGGLDRSPCLLWTIQTFCHTHWMCCYSVMIPSGHMTFIVPSILERDPPLFLSSRFLPFFSGKGFFYFLSFSWSDVVKGQGCRMCTDCEALWGKFIICDIGQYKIYRIELVQQYSFLLKEDDLYPDTEKESTGVFINNNNIEWLLYSG